MSIELTTVLKGEYYLVIASRLAPPGITSAQRLAFANRLANTNGDPGYTSPVYPGQVLWYHTEDIPAPPVVIPPPPPASTTMPTTLTGDGTLAIARALGTSIPVGATGTLTTTGTLSEQRYLTAADNGKVFENIHYQCMIRVDDVPGLTKVTYRNCRFTVGSWFGIFSMATNLDIYLDHCTIDGFTLDGKMAGDGNDKIGVVGRRIHAWRCEFKNLDNAARLDQGSRLWESWAHSPAAVPGSHVDGVEIYGGSDIQIVNSKLQIARASTTSTNPVEAGATAALNLATDFAGISDVLVDSTVLSGGGGTLLIRFQGNGADRGMQNLRFRNVDISDYLWFPLNRDASYPAGTFAEWVNVRDSQAGALIPQPV